MHGGELDEGQSRSDSATGFGETALHSLVDTVIVGKADARSGTGCLAVRQTGPIRRQLVEFPMQTPPASRPSSRSHRLSSGRDRARSFLLFRTRTFSSSLLSSFPRPLVLPLLPTPFFPFFSIYTLTLEKESRDIPDIFAFPVSTAVSILPGNFSPWSFVANRRDRGTRIKLL